MLGDTVFKKSIRSTRWGRAIIRMRLYEWQRKPWGGLLRQDQHVHGFWKPKRACTCVGSQDMVSNGTALLGREQPVQVMADIHTKVVTARRADQMRHPKIFTHHGGANDLHRKNGSET